ncbi:PLP-dependent aminotransferase family protein [Lederbergia citrea]|uniref:aminotransferase-like domain-containing protein n=1 Tax=Lederbergia citrea TaxID=2833581 RepID=UPI001BCA6260|nr:PLP-dependent aminotransferase family protein [Lederbergia citrea]MBS4203596.1 PLP-dependent aminotransferase family protein [Lederbergia citrea]
MMMKYEEIMRGIDQRIAEGKLKPGSKLPSIRSLSQELSCSRNTVIKAYDQLEKKHLIYAVPKSGYYIVDNNLSRKGNPKANKKIDFLSAGPDKQAMPFRDYQHCINQAIDLYKEDMFSYSEIQGLYSLRVQLSKQLQDLQVFTPPERICVVTGSQQALHLLASLPFPNGKTNICLEQPTHSGFIESIQHQKAVAFGIERNSRGIDLQYLEDIFKHHDIKCFYTVSRFHNPTGHSYTNVEKKKIVELAQKYDVYIIEDDYMGDLDTNLKQDPMYAYNPSGRVIYTKSFSKVMLPGLRLGLAVIPEPMIKSFLQAKYAADLHTPVLTQGALEIYLKSGMFHAHIQKMRTMYTNKGMVLQEAFKTYLRPSSYSCSLSGFYSTIELPKQLKATKLIERLKLEDVYVDRTNHMYLPDYKKENIIRLSVSQVEVESINIGVKKIAEGISRLLKERR